MTDEATATRTRTIALAGLGVIAAVLLAMFVIVPLVAGDDDETAETEVDVDVDVAQEEPTEAPTGDVELTDPDQIEGEPPAETFEVFNARDPFQQLVEDEAADDTAPADGVPVPPGTGEPPTGGTPAPTDGTPPPTGSTPPPTGETPPPTGNGTAPDDDDDDDANGEPGSDARVGGTTVTLVDVFTDDDGERRATVTVNGTGYTVAEGDTFARRFRLLDISGRCATMLFGDSRFTLCEGERIRK